MQFCQVVDLILEASLLSEGGFLGWRHCLIVCHDAQPVQTHTFQGRGATGDAEFEIVVFRVFDTKN